MPRMLLDQGALEESGREARVKKKLEPKWGSRRMVSMGDPEDVDPNGDWVILPEDARGKMLSSLQLRLEGGVDPVGVGSSGLRFRSWSAARYAAWLMQMKNFKLDWRPLKGKGDKL